jgi:hypothetical protein
VSTWSISISDKNLSDKFFILEYQGPMLWFFKILILFC